MKVCRDCLSRMLRPAAGAWNASSAQMLDQERRVAEALRARSIHWLGRHPVESDLLTKHSVYSEPNLRSSQSLVKRIVGISAGIEGIEGVPVIGIERKCQLDALG